MDVYLGGQVWRDLFLATQSGIITTNVGTNESFGFKRAVKTLLLNPSVQVFGKVIFTLKRLDAPTEVLECAGHGSHKGGKGDTGRR